MPTYQQVIKIDGNTARVVVAGFRGEKGEKGDTGAAGAGLNASATVVELSGTAAAGTSPSYSRGDHRHALGASGVAAGSYTLSNITVDEYGRVTSATNGAGGVTSVFGRTGAVVAAAGDYDASQVTGAAKYVGATPLECTSATNGIILKDLTTGGRVRLTISDGILQVAAL